MIATTMSETIASTEPGAPPHGAKCCHCGASLPTSESNAIKEIDTRLLLEVMKVTADASFAVGEAARLQAEVARFGRATDDRTAAIVTVSADQEKPQTESDEVKTTVGTSMAEDTRTGGVPTVRLGVAAMTQPSLVLCERVGCITREEWEAMSDKLQEELDEVLRKIVRRVCNHGDSLYTAGDTIYKELAAFRLAFDTPEGIQSGSLGWSHAANLRSSDLRRINAAMDSSRSSLSGNSFWYIDQMFMVVHRLMYLRGFQA